MYFKPLILVMVISIVLYYFKIILKKKFNDNQI